MDQIAFFKIFGKPLILYTGSITILSFMFTATIAVLNKKGIRVIPFKWHKRCAITSLTLAMIHGTIGFLTYF